MQTLKKCAVKSVISPNKLQQLLEKQYQKNTSKVEKQPKHNYTHIHTHCRGWKNQ